MVKHADDGRNPANLHNTGIRIPMVDIYETVEGEGTRAGYPTVFVRLYGCNLRCTWCDTKYSYPPYEAEFYMTIEEILERISQYRSRHVCVTGGEPLLYGERSRDLLNALASTNRYADIHVETNGAIHLEPFIAGVRSPVVRYIMDYKLPDSGEHERMIEDNLSLLREQDELKFVIATERDFAEAVRVIGRAPIRAAILFSPVWETMPPAKLAQMMLEAGLSQVKLNLQLHKIIWDPGLRRV
jgi:7-carboxy-7-deazaguanine synthase